MKKVFILCALVFAFGITYAQRKQASETFVLNQKVPPFGNVDGKLTYGYVVDDDGSQLKDGSYIINASKKNGSYGSSWESVDWSNCSYRLSANFSKGDLNGALSMSYKATLTAHKGRRSETHTYTSSITGNFLKGVPNGTFVVNNDLETKSSLTATYKNGIFTGNYKVSCIDDRGSYSFRPTHLKGTLDSQGRLTGLWTYDFFGNKGTMEFVNNILVSQSAGKMSTKPALVELSRKYAQKRITKEELLDKGIAVCVDSLDLGYLANCAIFDCPIIFKELGGYDFSTKETYKYEVLRELSILSDKGEKFLMDIVLSLINADDFSNALSNKYSYTFDVYRGDKYEFLHFDKESGLYFIKIPFANAEKWKPYTQGAVMRKFTYEEVKANEKLLNAYLLPEFFNKIDSCLHEKYKREAVSIFDLRNFEKNWVEINKFNSKEEVDRQIKEIKGILVKDNFGKSLYVVCENDSNYYRRSYYGSGFKYVYKSSLDSLEQYRKLLIKRSNEIMVADLIKNGVSEALAQKCLRNDELYSATLTVIKTAQYLVGKSVSNLGYRFGSSYLNKISPFCEIANFQILDIELRDGEGPHIVQMIIHKKDNNRIVSYQTDFEFKYNPYISSYGQEALFLESSIDFSKAQLVPNEWDKFQELDKNILEKLQSKLYPDISKSYKSYKKTLDISLDKNKFSTVKDRLKQCINVQKECLNFLDLRKQIIDKDKQIKANASQCNDVLKLYNSKIKEADIQWQSNVSTEKLQKVLLMQDSIVAFMGLRNLIFDKDIQVKSLSAQLKDVNKNYAAYIKMADVACPSNMATDKLNKIIQIQDSTLVFADLRNKIADTNVWMKNNAKKQKQVQKYYNQYMKTADLAWSSDVDINKLNEVIGTQELFKSAISSDKSAMIDMALKKSKPQTISDAIQLIKDNL